MRVLGVDPGLSGAVASWDGKTLYVSDIPTLLTAKGLIINIPSLCDILELEMADIDKAYIERVHAMPKQGVVSMFKFGRVYGNLEAVVQAKRIPLEYVSPLKWKSDYGLKSDKELARTKAVQLFPSYSPLFALKKYHGRAEAALIAKWGWTLENAGDTKIENLNS